MSTVKISKAGKDLNSDLEQIFRVLLKEGVLDNLIVPRRTPEKSFVYQVLHQGSDSLKDILPLSPVMPVNSATLLKKMTKFSGSEKKVGIVLKPCEMRAVVELVKLKQINLENIYLFTVDCPGTCDVELYSNPEFDRGKLEQELLKSYESGEQIEQVRQACKVCDKFYPFKTTDLEVGIFGTNGELYLISHSEKGEEILKSIPDLKPGKAEDRKKALDKIKTKRTEKKEKYFEKFRDEVKGLEKLSSFYSKCINCHNCMSQCPICICRECFFESSTFEYESDQILNWAGRNGLLKMPTDTLLFHLGRMNHMVTSCVSCGMCSQACPVGIDVGSMFTLTGGNAQAIFEYVPGRDFEEEIPISTFREDELKDLG